MDPRATQAAHNNACWCDAVGRSHGLSTRFHPGYWVQDGAFLPLYPNLVTISPHEVEVQLAAINQLAGRVNPGSWSVKDSYSTLELGPAALRPLFDAHWVHRPSAANHPGAIPAPEAGRWGKIDSAKELAAWESAWGQTPLDWSGRPLFQPALLADPDISIIAAREGRTITAGIIVNRSRDSAGFSNVFAARADPADLMSCVDAAAWVWPELDLVGYARGRELKALVAGGFECVGPLRVWTGTEDRT